MFREIASVGLVGAFVLAAKGADELVGARVLDWSGDMGLPVVALVMLVIVAAASDGDRTQEPDQ